MQVGRSVLHWRVFPDLHVKPLLEAHDFAESYAMPFPGTVLRVGPINGPSAVGAMVALAEEDFVPVIRIDQGVVTCHLRHGSDMLAFTFVAARKVVIT